jgi:crotonobetaine/carnitine-CoA ligase
VLSHPLVKDVAAVAVQNPSVHEDVADEEVKIVVVLDEGATLEPADLAEYLSKRMPRHWVPRFIEYTDALPRTDSHKLKKAELRDAGVTPETWDREQAGIVYKREVLT